VTWAAHRKTLRWQEGSCDRIGWRQIRRSGWRRIAGEGRRVSPRRDMSHRVFRALGGPAFKTRVRFSFGRRKARESPWQSRAVPNPGTLNAAIGKSVRTLCLAMSILVWLVGDSRGQTGGAGDSVHPSWMARQGARGYFCVAFSVPTYVIYSGQRRGARGFVTPAVRCCALLGLARARHYCRMSYASIGGLLLDSRKLSRSRSDRRDY